MAVGILELASLGMLSFDETWILGGVGLGEHDEI
jgi:hypothetical protein